MRFQPSTWILSLGLGAWCAAAGSATTPPTTPASTVRSTPAPASSLEARRKAFNDLLAEQWEDNLAHSPEFASILGDKRWNDQLSDLSLQAVEEEIARDRKYLARFEAIDPTGFPEQEALSYQLMVRRIRQGLDNVRFKEWEMPVTQISGIHLELAQFPAILTFTSAKDYRDLTTRYRKVPKAFDQVMALMRQGMQDGLMPPRFLLEKVVTQSEGLAKQKAETSPFAQPLGRFPKEIPEAEQQTLKAEMLAAIQEAVLPSYARFAAFVRDEYAPKGRTEPGMWSLPDGLARYAAAARRSTTTELTPEEILR